VPLEIYRAIAANHAPGIAQIQQVVWPNDDTSDSIALNRVIFDALQDTNRVNFVVVDESRVVGFADGFLTVSAEGRPRWEVDLLALHPDYRGLGLGARLVSASALAGREMGAQWARALIQVENKASQRAFIRRGFKPDPNDCLLYVSSGSVTNFFSPIRKGKRLAVNGIGPDSYFISVRTLYYRGLWLEGPLEFEAFDAAQAIREHYRWEMAGAVIPVNEQAAIQAARSAGYRKIDRYGWWRLDYASP